ncbi:hypothetical protein AGMMS49579_23850 [Spirochaetia bacterium]|nr:hypothetical protein AGMMS49579_23850 [Spirochaetia bacterium]
MSTQRTNFFIVIIAVILSERKQKNALLLMAIGLLLIIFLGSIRNGVSILKIMYPILGEGFFGSWGMLNAINYYLNNGYDAYNLIRPLNPAVNWLIPFLKLNTMSDGIAQSGIVYYPMGGFFFLSDAYLFHPIFGPIIYTIGFHTINSWSYKGMINSKNKMNYFLIQCLLFLYIKANVSTIIATFVFFFLLLYLYKIFEALLAISNKTIYGTNYLQKVNPQ